MLPPPQLKHLPLLAAVSELALLCLASAGAGGCAAAAAPPPSACPPVPTVALGLAPPCSPSPSALASAGSLPSPFSSVSSACLGGAAGGSSSPPDGCMSAAVGVEPVLKKMGCCISSSCTTSLVSCSRLLLPGSALAPCVAVLTSWLPSCSRALAAASCFSRAISAGVLMGMGGGLSTAAASCPGTYRIQGLSRVKASGP